MKPNFVIVYVAVIRKYAADALYRLTTSGSNHLKLSDDKSIRYVTLPNNEALESSRSVKFDESHDEINAAFLNDPPILLEYIDAKQADIYCNKICQHISLPNSV